MSYKEIVDRFEQAANQHYMIKDFGYGQLSDIKPQSQDNEADYPYMFLNPTSHTRAGVVLSYNFNLIMMDVATDEHDEYSNFLAIQSKCTQYIDDIIAEMYYGYTDKPEINMTNITYTPFKERFQDSLAGMTATITIDVPTPINRCIAPIAPVVNWISLNTLTNGSNVDWINMTAWEAYCAAVDSLGPWDGTQFTIPVGTTVEVDTQLYDYTNQPSTATGTYIFSSNYEPLTPQTWVDPIVMEVVDGIVTSITNSNDITCMTGQLVVDVYSVIAQQFTPDVSQSPLSCTNIVLNDGGWRPPQDGGNYYIPQTQDNYNWRIEGTVVFTQVNSGDSFRPLEIQDVGNLNLYPPTSNYGWPTTTPVVGQEYPFVLTYNDIPWSGSDFEAVNVIDTPESQAHFTTSIGTNVKIYRNI